MKGRFLFSSDWGTTTLRVRLVEVASGKILARLRSDQGARLLGLATTAADRAAAFEAAFLAATGKLAEEHGLETPVPAVISGMASSSIGWREVPYAPLPIGLCAADLSTETLAPVQPAPWLGPILLVGGLRTDDDVLRGEECQVLGLLSLPRFAALRAHCLVLLPGTHSKHVQVSAARVLDFQTYMTGEMAEMLAKHSILRDSVELGGPLEEAAFAAGIAAASQHPLLHGAFLTRTRALLHGQDRQANWSFLSGLLIGHELGHVPRDCPLLLAGEGPCGEAYALAARLLGLSANLTMASAEECESALALAHCRQTA